LNVSQLLRLLQTEHDETTAPADHPREHIERLTTALAETEARLAELTATRKVIDGLTTPDHAPAPAETATATVYQRIVTTFNEHPGKVFRVRDLHEHLGLRRSTPQTRLSTPAMDRDPREACQRGTAVNPATSRRA
jgi:hypothetical protein